MAAHDFVYGTGLFDSSYFCGYASEELASYLGIIKRISILDIIHEEDRDEFQAACDSVFEGNLSEASLEVRFKVNSGRYRKFYVNIRNYSDDQCMMEVVDIARACNLHGDFSFDEKKISSFFELKGMVLFEYNLSGDNLSVFKYTSGEKEPLDKNSSYDELLKKLGSSLRDFVESGSSFKYVDVIKTDAGTYSVEGVLMLKDTEKYCVFGDITPYDAATRPLENDSRNYDSSTGLFNKPYSLSLAKEALGTHNKVSLVMIDIDDFKSINDSYGHLFGDEVIRKFALIIRDASMHCGFAGRFGGDEYFMCLYDIENEQELRAVIQGIFYKFKTSFPDKDHLFSCSVGISEYPRNGRDFETLMKKADKGLYIAKYKGKNRYIIYKEAIHGEITNDSEETKLTGKTELERRVSELKLINEFSAQFPVWDKLESKEREEKASPFVEQMLTLYRIKGLSVYGGKGYPVLARFGNYSNPVPDASYMEDPRVRAQFNDLGIYTSSFNSISDNLCKNFQEYLKNHGIASTLQIIVKQGDTDYLFSFDREEDLGGFSVNEFQDLSIICHTIAYIFLK